MTNIHRLLVAGALLVAGCSQPRIANDLTRAEHDAAVDAFQTVHAVFMNPRCQNCHIPGDAPLQFDAGLPHAMGVVRGTNGHGAEGLACSACHGESNPPAHYGPHAPPGAPHWGLPPPDQKMAWIGMSPRQLCESIKDPRFNGNRDLAALVTHVSTDKLVLWGWNPGGVRPPVPVPHDEFVAQFRRWADAGGPCPTT
jgi:hypothetical protein